MSQPTAEHMLRELESLVGDWTMEARWPDGTPWPGGGHVTFRWHPSGAHLVQHGTVELPEAPENVSVIGCDAANGTYTQLYSDERGVCRIYEMSIGEASGGSGATASRSRSASRRPSAKTATRSPGGGRSPRTAAPSRPTSTSSIAGCGRESTQRARLDRARVWVFSTSISAPSSFSSPTVASIVCRSEVRPGSHA